MATAHPILQRVAPYRDSYFHLDGRSSNERRNLVIWSVEMGGKESVLSALIAQWLQTIMEILYTK